MTQADLTRERLVRAALELFTALGYHDTTTPAIAKKAGVAEGTIYRHFAGKQQFFNELYRASARWAGKLVKDAGATSVRLISIIAAPEGVDNIQRNHPDVQIVVAAIDRGLNEKGFIVPGLGDAGDRLYGTK